MQKHTDRKMRTSASRAIIARNRPALLYRPSARRPAAMVLCVPFVVLPLALASSSVLRVEPQAMHRVQTDQLRHRLRATDFSMSTVGEGPSSDSARAYVRFSAADHDLIREILHSEPPAAAAPPAVGSPAMQPPPLTKAQRKRALKTFFAAGRVPPKN